MTETTDPGVTPPSLRRGDLLLSVTVERASVVGHRRDDGALRVRLGRVTSVSRAGLPLRWVTPENQDAPDVERRFDAGSGRYMHARARDVDVDGALAAYRAHTWGATSPATHSRAVRPLESLEAARALLRPYRLAA